MADKEDPDPKKIKDPAKVLLVMENAKRLKKKGYWEKCFSHYCDLKAAEHQTESSIVNGYYKFLHTYKQALTEKNGRRTPATHLKQMVENRIEKHGNDEKGIVAALAELVTKKDTSAGFQYLMVSEQGYLTAEHLVEKHPQHFSEETVTSAIQKLYGWDASMADSEIQKLTKDIWGL